MHIYVASALFVDQPAQTDKPDQTARNRSLLTFTHKKGDIDTY